MNIIWLLQKGLFDEEKEAEHLERMGAKYYEFRNRDDLKQIYYGTLSLSYNKEDGFDNPIQESIIIPRCSVEWYNYLYNQYEYVYPFKSIDHFDCMNYYPIIGEYLLNDDYSWMTFGELLNNKSKVFNEYGSNWCNVDSSIFIRPQSGNKTFSGQVISWRAVDSFVHDINYNELVIVSSVKKLEYDEMRFVVVDGKIVSGSTYGLEKESRPIDFSSLDNRYQEDVQRIIDKYQRFVYNRMTYINDIAYTLDVVVHNLAIKLIEINSLTCAGLYKCDIESCFRAVEKHALEYFEEEYK